MRGLLQLLFAIGSVAGALCARADETDQFMTWGLELSDSVDTINDAVNDLVRDSVKEANHSIEPPCDCPAMAYFAIDHLFNGRLTSRLLERIDEDDSIDVYPPRSVTRTHYQRSSIYRGLSFPFILPMGRTLRVGEIYFGADKWGHFFGMGKRYYRHYLWYRENGIPEEKAIDMTISWGVMTENTFVGLAVDGIFSHADLEANYQGFELARHMCEGDAPYIVGGKRGWELDREIDLRDYVTPYWDESYNPSHYWGRRRLLVMPILRDEYAAMAQSPAVIERFRAYEKYPLSRSVEFILEYFLDRNQHPQRDQTFAALGLQAGYPATQLAIVPLR